MTSASFPALLLLVSLASATSCDRSKDGPAPDAPPDVAAAVSDEAPTPKRLPDPPPQGSRDAPAGEWTVQSHHPRLHQLDDDAWAEFSLEFLSGVVQTRNEADGLRVLSIGRGAVAGQVGLLPGDLLLSIGATQAPALASLHDTWALAQRTHWAEIRRLRDGSTETIFLWIRSRSTAQSVASSLVRLGVVQQEGGRRLIDRALLETLADMPWLHQNRELWQSLGVPGGGPVLRVDDENIGKNGLELALQRIGERAAERTFELTVGTDDGEARLQYEVIEDVLDSEALSTIKATPKPASAYRRGGPAGSRSKPATTLDAVVTENGEHRYSIDRDRFAELLADPSVLARSARIVPSQKDGETVGFKLYGIRRSSLLDKLGFHNGDLLVSVQGRPIGDFDEALEAYAAVSKAPPETLRVTIVRRGVEIELKLDLE
ncbi:MAG: hypothetical protein ACRBN8_13355 [Nannocystales bacterium]